MAEGEFANLEEGTVRMLEPGNANPTWESQAKKACDVK